MTKPDAVELYQQLAKQAKPVGRVGRPSKGKRVPIALRLNPELVEQIEAWWPEAPDRHGKIVALIRMGLSAALAKEKAQPT